MSFKVLFHPSAESDYVQAYQWYEERLEGLGERFNYAVERQVMLILKNPEHYQLKKRGCRESKVIMFPYIIVYKIYADLEVILIVGVFHTGQNPVKKYRRRL